MPSDPFYQSKDWWKLRSQVKAKWQREGLPCGICNKPIDWSERPIADHIEPRSKRPDLEYTPSNIQYLHHACHSMKTNRHEKLNLPKIGLDGMPEDGSWG